MAAWRQDLTYAFRRLSKSPGFAAAAVVSIGLGIGANATIFSMVSRFLLRPAPVGDPGTLMTLHTTRRGECCNNSPGPCSPICASKPSRFPAWRPITNLFPPPLAARATRSACGGRRPLPTSSMSRNSA